MFLNECAGRPKLLLTQAVILRLGDHRLKPEFGFAVRALHVDVHSGLLSREKVKSKAPVAKYRRTHELSLCRCWSVGT
jgi:hypothetical protein